MLSPQPTRTSRTPAELASFPELAHEGQRLMAADLAARFPVGLRCTRCGLHFLWLAAALRMPALPATDRLPELSAEWQPMVWNFVATIAEPAFCPGCRFVDEYALIEDPRPAFRGCLARLESMGTAEARHLAARLDPVGASASGPRPKSPLEMHLEQVARLAGPRQDATTLTRFAQGCIELKQSVRGLAAARQALQIEPKALEPYLVMADVARTQRVWPEALNLLRRAGDLLSGGAGVRLIRSADRAAALLADALTEVSDRAPALWTPQDERRIEAARAMTGAPSWMA